MIVRRLSFASMVLCVAAALAARPQGQQTQRFLYAALPGVGGGNNVSYGGAGILVFDIDHGHKFVKRVPMPTALALPAATNGRPVSPQEAIKGIAAHAPTARLYVSTNRRVAAYDLMTDKLVWEQRYEDRGTDRIALSPDGSTLYAPELGAPKWVVADARTGALITTIDKPGNPHNTQYSDDGTRVYFEAEGNTRTMSVVDARTRKIIKEIGPFGNMVRPFTFNGKQTLLFANINDFLGFEVADLETGAILHHVEVPGVTPGRSPTHGIPSHGIAMTQDETEILDRRQREQLRPYLRRHRDAAGAQGQRQGARRARLDHVRHRRPAGLSLDRRRDRRAHQADRRDAPGRERGQRREREDARDRLCRGQAGGRRRSVRQGQEALDLSNEEIRSLRDL